MLTHLTPLALIRGYCHRRAVLGVHPMLRSPNRNRARLRLEGLEGRCLLSGISGFTEYPIPTPSAGDTAIVTGSDGNLWFLENSANKIGMINTTTHAMTEFSIPTANANPWGIAAGPDGNIWFTERSANKIGMINLTTHAISDFSTGAMTIPVGIASGPDGNVWFTAMGSGNAIGKINTSTHAVSGYPTPSGFVNRPMWITSGPDGNLWISGASSNTLARFNPTTHISSVFVAPGTSFGYADVYHLTSGSDGNVWFTDYNGNAVGKINPTTGAVTEYQLPDASYVDAYGITSGPDGNIWFTEVAAGQIGMINPTTDVIAEYPIDHGVNQIATGPDGDLWFTDNTNNAIGAATLSTSELIVAQQPPASVVAGSSFGLTVEAEDSSGNLLTSFNGTVTVSLAGNPGGDTLGGTQTVTASNGVATFTNLSLTKAASGYTLQVSGTGLAATTTGAITVTPLAASQVVITQQQPSSVTAGADFDLVASIEDVYGNVVTTASSTVTVALANNPGGSTLGGTLSATPSLGLATFSGLTLTKAASGYTFSVSGTGLTGSTSSATTVTPAAASQLVISQQPPVNVAVNATFSLVLAIEDAFGNVVSSANNKVSVALGNNPNKGKLGGTTSVKAIDGYVTFSDLTISKTGTGYTLVLSSTGLAEVTTSGINVS